MSEALNRLCKWRTILAGWQLGTRSKEDPECQAVRDQRELLLLLRAEVNALTTLLIERKVLTADAFGEQCDIEAGYLEQELERKFPGVKATAVGLTIDPAAAGWMKDFRP
jgi:hypothetical protein